MLGREIFVNKAGVEEGDCLSPDKGCRSVYEGVIKSQRNDDILIVSEEVDVDGRMINMKVDMKIIGKKDDGKVILNVARTEMNLIEKGINFYIGGENESVECSFEGFDFIIDEKGRVENSEVVFVESNSGVEIKRCIFERGEENRYVKERGMNCYMINCEGELKMIDCCVKNFIFENGGGVKGKDVFIKSCIFRDIIRKEGNGGGIEVSGGIGNIVGCLFERCVCSEGKGGGIYLSMEDLMKEGKEKEGKESRRNGRKERGIMSSIYREYRKNGGLEGVQRGWKSRSEGGVVRIKRCIFESCEGRIGESVYLNIKGRKESVNVDMDEIMIDKEKEEKNGEGKKDVVIVCEDVRKMLKKKKIKFGEEMKKRMGGRIIGFYNEKEAEEGRNGVDVSGYLNGEGEESVWYIGDGGNDGNDCKDESKMCKNLDHVSNLFGNGVNKVIIVGNVSIEGKEVKIKGDEIVLEGKDDNSKVVFGQSSGIEIEGGEMKMKNVEIVMKQSYSCNEEKGAIEIGDGCDLKVNGVKIKGEGGNVRVKRGVIKIGSGNLYMSDCEIRGFKREEEEEDNELIISSTGYLMMNGTKIEECNCVNGRGGGMYLEREGGYTIIGDEGTDTEFNLCSAQRGGGIYIEADYCRSFEFRNVKFGSGEKSNSGNNGKNIFVNCYYLDYLCVSLFDTLKNEVSEGNLFEGTKGEESEDTTIYDLVKIIKGEYRIGGEILYVGDGGRGSQCNREDAGSRCSDLMYAVGLVKFGVVNVRVIEKLKTNGGTIYGGGFKIEGKTSETQVESGEYFCFDINTDSEWKNLKFILKDNNEYSIIHIYTGNFEMENVVFSGNGGIVNLMDSVIVWESFGNGIMKNCTLKNVCVSGIEGGGIRGYARERKKLEVKGVDFVNCSSDTGNGGGMCVYIEEGGSLIICGDGEKKSSFKNCKIIKKESKKGERKNNEEEGEGEEEEEFVDEGNGGGIYMKVEKNSGAIVVNDSEFGKREEKNEGVHGSNLFIYAEDLVGSVKEEDFGVLSDEEASEGIEGYEKGMESVIHLSDLFGEVLTVVFVSGDGVDSFGCGKESAPCKNLKKGIEKGMEDMKNISIIGWVENRETINVEIKSEFGSKEGRSCIVAEEECLFIISVDCLFKIIGLNVSSAKNTIVKGIGGVMKFEDVVVKGKNEEEGVTLESSVVCIESEGSGEFVKCIFEGMKVKEGDGGGMKAVLKNGKSLKVKGCVFEKCGVMKGSGGGIFVEMGEGSNFIIEGEGEGENELKECFALKNGELENGEEGRGGGIYVKIEGNVNKFSLEKIKMGTEGEKNKADDGYDLFIKAKSLEEACKGLVNIITSSSSSSEGMVGIEEGMSESISLYYIISDNLETTFILNGSEDYEKYCGIEEYPCGLLSVALKRNKGEKKNIKIMGQFYYSEIVDIDVGSKIESKEGRSEVIGMKGCAFVVSAECEFFSLNFNICNIKSTFIKIEEGLLYLNNIIINGTKGDDCVSLSSSLIDLDSKGSVIICLSNISGVKVKGMNGSVINGEVEDGGSVEIRGSVFSKCKCSGGNGGGIYVIVGKNGKFVVGEEGEEKSVIKGCSAKNSEDSVSEMKGKNEERKGRGGGLYIKIESEVNNISINNVIFGGEGEGEKNEADEGYDLFVETKSLNESIDSDSFGYIEDLDDEYDGAMGIEEGKEEAEVLTQRVKKSAESKKKKSYWWISLIVIFVVGIIGAIVGIIIVIMCKKKRSDDYKKFDEEKLKDDGDINDTNNEKEEVGYEAPDNIGKSGY